MSEKLNNPTTKQSFVHEYEAEWEVSEITGMSFRSMRTPTFFPISGLDLAFCFEFCYIFFKNPDDDDKMFLLNLHLVKQLDFDVSPTLKLTVEVEVCNGDDSLFKELKSPVTIVKDMNHFKFDSIVSKCRFTFNRSQQQLLTEKFVIKYHMNFCDQPSLIKYFEESNAFDSYREFSKNLSAIYSNSISNDIVIKIGDKSLTAHKSILIAHSPVFSKMLTSDFKESSNNCIVISDSTYEIFDIFLKYLYSGDIENKSWPVVKEIYILADKYDVKTLKKRCVVIIKSYLSIDTLCDVFAIAFACEDETLKRVANVFAAVNISDIVSREDWRKLVVNYPLISNEVMTIVVNNIRK